MTVRNKEQQELSRYIKEKPKVINQTKFVLSPMPGNVISVSVKPGDVVSEGQELAVVEAMKMQHLLHAERVGTIKAVLVQEGRSVKNQQIVIEFEDEPQEVNEQQAKQ